MYYSFLERKKRIHLEGLINKGLKLGNNVVIVEEFLFDPAHCFLISIGENCVICPNVRLIAHDASSKKVFGFTKIGKIDIKENCFIGDSTIILPGVTIGPNSITGAGSVVTKDVPPNSIAAGNPARVIATMDEYVHKLKLLSRDKKMFNEDYLIWNINEEKRRELLEAIGNTIGFIV